MFKTIFSKLIAIFVSILIFGFSVTGVALYFFLTDFVLNEKVKLLEQSGQQIEGNFQMFVENLQEAQKYINPATRDFAINLAKNSFERSLELYSIYTNSYVWIVDDKGNILFSRPALPAHIRARLLTEENDVRLPDKRQYEKVMTGDVSTVKEIGDFYGFFSDEAFKKNGASWLTIEKPFRYRFANSSGESIAAVYLHTPVPEVQRARTSVFGFFMKSGAVAILISIVLVYIFSLRISKPLKQINHAAKVIAGGEFRKRLNIHSRDEIGELAQSFNQMVVALQNLEEMRRGFIANVSHELRTPMTSIRGFIEGILDGTIPPERQSYYLTVVRDEANRLNRLVNDLLDLAKMEAGELAMSFKEFNINELVRRSIIKLESLIVEKDLQVEASFEEEELFVYADTDAIERVIINLVHNAIKFTPEKGKIILTTWTQKDKVLVSVEDTGIGIGKDEIDLIWERFYKSDKSRSRDKTGTGLGLAIIKNIINEHKQSISVESELGKGTKFTFTLDRVYSRNEI